MISSGRTAVRPARRPGLAVGGAAVLGIDGSAGAGVVGYVALDGVVALDLLETFGAAEAGGLADAGIALQVVGTLDRLPGGGWVLGHGRLLSPDSTGGAGAGSGKGTPDRVLRCAGPTAALAMLRFIRGGFMLFRSLAAAAALLAVSAPVAAAQDVGLRGPGGPPPPSAHNEHH